MTDFLLELRSEEIPARMQAGARAELDRLLRRELDAAGVAVGDLTVWSTPRRLALIARDLPLATQAVSEEAKGPPVGAPDAAVDGFCAKNGVTREQLEARDVKGRATWFAVIDKPGRATSEVLAQAIPAIVRDFSWPKSMRWGAASVRTESLRWVRPLSGIVALLGEELVECEAGGVRSGYATMGHRFHHSGEITIGSASDYAEKLRACHVIVDHEERQDMIRTGAAAAAAAAGLTLVADEGLVIENAGLTEWPVPLLGRFDEAFLDVPPEVIQLTARVNQKYFVCEDASGKLANAFVCTANISAADGGAAIVDGNRKVLAARLSDARFFWEQDRKTRLEDPAKKLERITFHEKLGTVADKVERVAKLARWLVEEGIILPGTGRGTSEAGGGAPSASKDPSGSSVSPVPLHHPAGGPPPLAGEDRARLATVSQLADWAEQAARLAKADLVTEMVGEFPELQGVMGGYYARAEGLDLQIADAIRDHYKPVGQGDEVPTAPVTVAVSLADKLDTLFAFFAVGEAPTGSKDPFALRRAAYSVIRLMLVNKVGSLKDSVYGVDAAFSATLHKMREAAQEQLQHEVDDIHRAERAKPNFYDKMLWYAEQARLDQLLAPAKRYEELASAYHSAYLPTLSFIIDRLKVQQREEGLRHDIIDAVFFLRRAESGRPDPNLLSLLARVKALQHYIETAEGADLLAAYKRAANILRKENWSPATAGASGEGAPAEGGLRLRGDSAPLDSQGIARTGEEDPLSLVDDPDMAAVIKAQLEEKKNKSLSYTREPAEDALVSALDSAEPAAVRAVEAEDFAGAMAALATLRGPIDAFFDSVTVNDPDRDKRAARLGLLARFRDAVHRVADFGRIEG